MQGGNSLAQSISAELQELQSWKLAGSVTWHLLPSAVAYCTWAAASFALGISATPFPSFSFSGFTAFVFVLSLQGAVLVGHYFLITASEPTPLYFPALGLHGRGWLGVLVSRVFARGRNLQDLISTGILVASSSVSAVLTVFTYTRTVVSRGSTVYTVPDFLFCTGFGGVLGALYTIQHLSRCRNVLSYPSVHRHRAFQLRQKLPMCILDALKISVTAFAITLAAGYRPASWSSVIPVLHASSFCVWTWLAAQTALDIVFTEPMKLSSMSASSKEPVRSMCQIMSDTDPVVRDLALQELAAIAQAKTQAANQWRACMWSDETGRAGWSPLATALCGEIRDLTSAVTLALPGRDKGPEDLNTATKVQWNVVALSSSTGSKQVSRAQDMAAWAVRSKYYRAGFALRALSGLAASSRLEDRFGCILMVDPVLGDVTCLLASTVLALQQYSKLVVSSGQHSGPVISLLRKVLEWTGPTPHPSLQQVEVVAAALEDTARCCLGQIVQAFGPGILTAVQRAGNKPVYGSLAEISNLLNGILAGKE